MMTFSPATIFYDVEGIPVTLGAGQQATPGLLCAAWDTTPPRAFDPASARRNGAEISADRFRAMAKLVTIT